MQLATALIRDVLLPLFGVGLVVAAIAVVTHHFSKPKAKAPYIPHREVTEVGREFMSAHPVGGEGSAGVDR